jgi:hypothetical protein
MVKSSTTVTAVAGKGMVQFERFGVPLHVAPRNLKGRLSILSREKGTGCVVFRRSKADEATGHAHPHKGSFFW